jgi:rhodanese-related sulfurtransferase
VLVCKTDRRPTPAAGALLGLGLGDVAVLRGGIDGWRRLSLALE